MTEQNKQHNGDQPADFTVLPWVAGALLILGIAVLAGVYGNRSVVVQDARYNGHHFVEQQELADAADVPTGISPDSVDFMKIINQVERIPFVKQAAIEVEPGGDLTINVTERQPIAILSNGDEKIYVDQDGIRLPLKLGKTVDVPIVYGFNTEPMGDTLKSEAWMQTRNFLTEINSSTFNHATISEVAWTKKEGIVALSHENGVKLVFGKDEFSKKLRNWKAFYSEIIREKGIQKMKSVDLRFEGQIVTRES